MENTLTQTTPTRWEFTGQHTRGRIERVRDGLVVRFIAHNSNGKTSGQLPQLHDAENWLQNHDTGANQ